MTTGAAKILKQMSEAEKSGDDFEAEIIVDGRSAFLGVERIPKRIVDELLLAMAIRGDEIGSSTYYRINETGEAILRRPALEYELQLVIRKGGSWTIENDRLKEI